MTSVDLTPVAHAIRVLSRGAFLARRALAPRPGRRRRPPPAPSGPRRRNILFVTIDQQRHDALGVTGHPFARTPVVDALAREGVRYRRAHVQNVVCMPSRATMLTGQHPLTHGVVANGIPLADDAPNVARLLRSRGLPHGAARQGALRSAPRPAAALSREPARRRARRDPVARLRSRRARDARPDRRPSLRGVALRASPRGRRRLRRRAHRRRRRRDRRARGGAQPHPARALPHGLGRRSHHRVAALARSRSRRSSAG